VIKASWRDALGLLWCFFKLEFLVLAYL
jgi:hypothetical protein